MIALGVQLIREKNKTEHINPYYEKKLIKDEEIEMTSMVSGEDKNAD